MMTTLPIEIPTVDGILAAVDDYGRAEYRRGQPVAHSRDIAVRRLGAVASAGTPAGADPAGMGREGRERAMVEQETGDKPERVTMQEYIRLLAARFEANGGVVRSRL